MTSKILVFFQKPKKCFICFTIRFFNRVMKNVFFVLDVLKKSYISKTAHQYFFHTVMASTIHSVVLSDGLQTGPTSQGFWCKVACLIVKVITWYGLAIGIFRNELDEKHKKWNQMFIIKCSGSFTDPCMECKSLYAVIVLNLILF